MRPKDLVVIPHADLAVSPAQAALVRRVGPEMVVRAGLRDLPDDVQQQIWDSAHKLAALDGWFAPEDDGFDCIVDEDGSERYPLVQA